MSSETNKKGWYEHDSLENCNTFYIKVRAEARGKSDQNVFTVLDNPTSITSTHDRNTASATLFDIMIGHIKSPTLMNTLVQSYMDDGHKAMQYIRGCWSAASDENKMIANHEEYRDIAIRDVIAPDITVIDLRDKMNQVFSLRNTLDGTDRAIADKLFSSDIVDMIRRISRNHEVEITFLKAEISAKIDKPSTVVGSRSRSRCRCRMGSR